MRRFPKAPGGAVAHYAHMMDGQEDSGQARQIARIGLARLK